jgi:hypothetical protein
VFRAGVCVIYVLSCLTLGVILYIIIHTHTIIISYTYTHTIILL